ncbi:unnamed protein product [Moneuplotes crassus]|uniref:Uncharacterized protein n=1 Tax=Euplotes crassus TaxID=5936 RepID=A0AAD1XR65_EUPCR|nr:unnamed protein product [Moneuplotes crassus]
MKSLILTLGSPLSYLLTWMCRTVSNHPKEHNSYVIFEGEIQNLNFIILSLKEVSIFS